MIWGFQGVTKKYPLRRCNVKEGESITQLGCIIHIHFITPSGNEEDMIENFLSVGKQNAIPSKRLADLAGCKSVRELQQVIAAERAAGAVILSTCENGGGYFLPESVGEVKEFVRTLESRGKNTLSALQSARKYLKDHEIEGDNNV